jgi:hypothetical protein
VPRREGWAPEPGGSAPQPGGSAPPESTPVARQPAGSVRTRAKAPRWAEQRKAQRLAPAQPPGGLSARRPSRACRRSRSRGAATAVVLATSALARCSAWSTRRRDERVRRLRSVGSCRRFAPEPVTRRLVRHRLRRDGGRTSCTRAASGCRPRRRLRPAVRPSAIPWGGRSSRRGRGWEWGRRTSSGEGSNRKTRAFSEWPGGQRLSTFRATSERRSLVRVSQKEVLLRHESRRFCANLAKSRSAGF